MTFEPFRSIVLSGQVPRLAPKTPDQNLDPQAATDPIPAPPASMTVERPGVGPAAATPAHPERPESLHHRERDDDLEETVRPPSTVLTKEWVFAQTQTDVDSALGQDGPREATISPAKIPAARPAPVAQREPRTAQTASVPDLNMAPLPQTGIREELTGSVPSLHDTDGTAPRQFVVAYSGSLIGTYRGQERTPNATIFQKVSEQLAGQIDGFDPAEIRLFQLTEISRRESRFEGDPESEFTGVPTL